MIVQKITVKMIGKRSADDHKKYLRLPNIVDDSF